MVTAKGTRHLWWQYSVGSQSRCMSLKNGVRGRTNVPANARRRACAKARPWLKTLMVQCGWTAARKKDSYYKAQFNRLRGTRGAKKAICAVAASMLTAIYH